MKKYAVIIINVALLLVLVFLRFFSPVASDLITTSGQVRAILSFVVFYTVVTILSNTAKYLYSKRNKIPRNKKNNVHFGIENISNFIVTVAFLLMILSIFGVDPKEMLTSLTIVAAALAILTKEYIVDFLSGIYLSFANIFEIGDYVKLEHQKGKIIEINMLKVKILNDDDDLVILPNSKVHYNQIINYTKRDARLMSVDFQIALKYIQSIVDLERELISSLGGFREFIEPKSYSLKVVEMKMDYLELKFQYTLKVVDMDLQRKIRKKTIREVFNFISSKKNFQAPAADN